MSFGGRFDLEATLGAKDEEDQVSADTAGINIIKAAGGWDADQGPSGQSSRALLKVKQAVSEE